MGYRTQLEGRLMPQRAERKLILGENRDELPFSFN